MNREQCESPCAGHTVTPIAPGRNEQIVGHVLARVGDGFIEVLWLSSERGAFTCTEVIGDVVWHQNIDPPGNYEPRYIGVTIAAVAD